MKAAVFYGSRDVRVEEIEPPKLNEDGLILKVLASNMCGTDLKTYVRGHPLIKKGTVMGHEYSGVVIDSSGSFPFKRGDYVVGSNSVPCMECYICKKGSYSLCTNIKKKLVGFTVNGSHAEMISVPPEIVKRNMYRFNNSKPEHIACAEPLASVIHGAEKLKVKEDETVAIIGSGAIGLMFLQVLKLNGAKVIMTNRSEDRLEVAEKLGADVLLKVGGEDIDSKIKNATGGNGADVVIEAVGKRETWEVSLKAARDGGRILLFGGCASGTFVSFDAEMIHYGERQLIGSFHHEPNSFRKAVELIEKGLVRLERIVDMKIRLDSIIDGFKMMEERKALKVSIEP
jgi:L-iditol 2-dehydrogenase